MYKLLIVAGLVSSFVTAASAQERVIRPGPNNPPLRPPPARFYPLPYKPIVHKPIVQKPVYRPIQKPVIRPNFGPQAGGNIRRR